MQSGRVVVMNAEEQFAGEKREAPASPSGSTTPARDDSVSVAARGNVLKATTIACPEGWSDGASIITYLLLTTPYISSSARTISCLYSIYSQHNLFFPLVTPNGRNFLAVAELLGKAWFRHPSDTCFSPSGQKGQTSDSSCSPFAQTDTTSVSPNSDLHFLSSPPPSDHHPVARVTGSPSSDASSLPLELGLHAPTGKSCIQPSNTSHAVHPLLLITSPLNPAWCLALRVSSDSGQAPPPRA